MKEYNINDEVFVYHVWPGYRGHAVIVDKEFENFDSQYYYTVRYFDTKKRDHDKFCGAAFDNSFITGR
jgi:hypothetical protein